MASNNIYTRTVNSTLLQGQLAALSSDLQASLASTDTNTLESYLAQSYQVLAEFYEELGTPVFDPDEIIAGDIPELTNSNVGFTDILADLNIIFAEMQNIEGLVVGNYNYAATEVNRLSGKLATVSSLLGNYILFANDATSSVIYFNDQFENLNEIDQGSSLLTEPQCNIDPNQGIVSLPLNSSATSIITITATPVIGSNSNGVAGNNFQIGAALNNDIGVILNNNPDTWFEYEYVVTAQEDVGTPLILDLYLDMSVDQVINYIRINPNNFGAPTQVEIDVIETSEDNKTFTSIETETAIPGYQLPTVAGPFVLAPSISQYAGQGIYSFLARFARYIHIRLKQTSAYTIQTAAGPRSRYAIGIRGIEVDAFQYQNVGQIVSTPYTTNSPILQLALVTTQVPDEASDLSSIEHEISPDGGATWYQLAPEGNVVTPGSTDTTPEVLEFNTNTPNAITTSNPVTSVIYRATLARDDSAFSSSSSLAQETDFATELHQVPSTSPFVVTLNNTPIVGSVSVIDPHYGSRGISTFQYQIGTGTGSAVTYQLPFSPITMDKEKVVQTGTRYIEDVSPALVFVGAQQWIQGLLSTANSIATVYQLDQNAGTISFGNGVNGRAPDNGAPISFYLTPERAYMTPVLGAHQATLAFPTNMDQSTVTVQRYDPIISTNEVLGKGANVFQLANQNLIRGTISFLPTGIFTSEQTYVNGSLELSGTGQYSIDYTSGYLYSYSYTGTTSDVSISYQYQPILTLQLNDWSFVGTDPLVDTIQIEQSGYATIPVALELVASGVNKFSLANFSIEPGTLTFSDTTTAFVTEVPFVDGSAEILGLLQATEAIQATAFQGAGPVQFHLLFTPANATLHTVIFSNTAVFKNFTNSPVSPGDYSISGTLVRVITTGAVAQPGSVSYLYADPTAYNNGVYSVNYPLGEVYTYTATVGATANYQYSDFLISYPIGRVVSQSDITVDGSTVILSDSEVLNRLQIPLSSAYQSSAAGSTYQFLYDYVATNRSGLSALDPYFTPVLKEYILKVLTQAQLIGGN